MPRDAGSCRGFSGEGTSEGRCFCNSGRLLSCARCGGERGRTCDGLPVLTGPAVLARGEQVRVPLCHQSQQPAYTQLTACKKPLCQLVLQPRACAADTQRSTAGLAPATRRRPLRPNVFSPAWSPRSGKAAAQTQAVRRAFIAWSARPQERSSCASKAAPRAPRAERHPVMNFFRNQHAAAPSAMQSMPSVGSTEALTAPLRALKVPQWAALRLSASRPWLRTVLRSVCACARRVCCLAQRSVSAEE